MMTNTLFGVVYETFKIVNDHNCPFHNLRYLCLRAMAAWRPRGPKLSANELFTNADVNGDNALSKEEFESSLPKKP